MCISSNNNNNNNTLFVQGITKSQEYYSKILHEPKFKLIKFSGYMQYASHSYVHTYIIIFIMANTV